MENEYFETENIKVTKCKHCGAELEKVLLPYDSDFLVPHIWVCFNDECGYYKRGWDWMREKFNVRASYRFKYNGFTQDEGPLPVQSPYTWMDMRESEQQPAQK
ncbi:MAG: hypothetical protein ACLFQX_00825 [Candidatus Kapaibacterium sp.]